jgi:hypothetical protein
MLIQNLDTKILHLVRVLKKINSHSSYRCLQNKNNLVNAGRSGVCLITSACILGDSNNLCPSQASCGFYFFL